MAAGLGFKDFTTGEVLTAADVDGYLMQGIWVFADSAARDAAVTSPQEGNFAFLKDTNTTTYYTGSAWTNLDTTGMVNPMTTTGDVIYSSSGSTPARLGIGTAGQVLQVNSGATAPEWATPAGGGGKVLQVVSATYSTNTTVSTTTFTDSGLSASITPSLATSKVLILSTTPVQIEDSPQTNIIGGAIRLLRDSTEIYKPAGTNDFGIGAGRSIYMPVSMVYLDSPATTSSLTYKVQGKPQSTANGQYLAFQSSSGTSSMILLEIGA